FGLPGMALPMSLPAQPAVAGPPIKTPAPAKTEPPAKTGPKKQPLAKKKFTQVPPQFAMLPVMNDMNRMLLIDPEKKGHTPIFSTTDTSNSQFAILALWAARRHDVPIARTLHRIAMRYHTSQNKDGSWDYHYVFGGSGKGRPAMTAVGLLGLAVG